LWEGLGSSDRVLLQDGGIKLAPDVLLLSTATPPKLLSNALIVLGVSYVLFFALLVASYRMNLRTWQNEQARAAAGKK